MADNPVTNTGSQQTKTGVLLIALGTPAGLTKRDIRDFLREFLADRRVVDLPPLLWYPILYGPLSWFRPGCILENYEAVWDHERDASPLKVITSDQAEGLAGKLGKDIPVEWAFTYGNPSVADRLDALVKAGCTRVIAVPLYPQFSYTTTAAAMDKVDAAVARMDNPPAIVPVRSWHRHPAYIKALAGSIRESLDGLDWPPERIVTSYHGIPVKGYRDGDPYPDEARETTDLLIKALDMDEGNFETVFQSRFGAAEWVKPYADARVTELAEEGVKGIVVVAPAFLADCLETLEELNMELRETFEHAGGTHFHYVPCLNASDRLISALEAVVRDHL